MAEVQVEGDIEAGGWPFEDPPLNYSHHTGPTSVDQAWLAAPPRSIRHCEASVSL